MEGGGTKADSFTPPEPVRLPGETNNTVPVGTVQSFSGTGTALATDTMTVTTASLDTVTAGLFPSDPNNLSQLVNLTLEITSGDGTSRFWQIRGVASDAATGRTSLTLLNPNTIKQPQLPDAGSGFAITYVASTNFVPEGSLVNTMTVFDTAAGAGSSGVISGTTGKMTLTNFGMSAGTEIDYSDVESVQFYLSTNVTSLNVSGSLEEGTPDDSGGYGQTVTSITTVAESNPSVTDAYTIDLNDNVPGIFALNMEGGLNNIIQASQSELPLVLFGGEGNNTIYGGQGGDIIVGHEGLVDYADASGNVITRLGLGLNDGTVLSPGQAPTTDTQIPYYQNNNSFNPATLIETRNDTSSTGLDTIVAGAGNNVILGGAGDTISAGDGNNIIVAAYGQVTGTSAGFHTNVQTTSPGGISGDNITVGNGNNIVIGAGGNNAIQTGNGANVIIGDEGAVGYDSMGALSSIATTNPAIYGINTINVGNGNNIIFGGSGVDNIAAGDGDNIIFGDNGQVQYQAAGVLGTIESTYPTSGGNDTIKVGNGNNMIFGGPGSDTITAGNGNNTIFGDDGEIQSFSSGLPSLIESIDVQVVGNNTITVGDGNNLIFGGSGADHIAFGNGNNIVFGDNGMVQYAASGVRGSAETTNSGIGGDDVITGGNGSNYVFGGFGDDTITLGGVTAGTNSSASIVMGDNGEIDFDSQGLLPVAAYSVDNGTGGNDTIRVAAGNNFLIGGAGADWLYGGTGDDVIVGDGARITWAGSTEIIESIDLQEGGDDVLSGGGGRNIMIGETGATPSSAASIQT